jgi:hypothetical protein
LRNGRAQQVGILAHRFANLQAIGVRQHDIQQNQIRPYLPAEIQRAFAGLASGQHESFPLQVVLQQANQVGVVFNQKDLPHVQP